MLGKYTPKGAFNIVMALPNYLFNQFDGRTNVGAVELPGSCDYDIGQQVYHVAGAGANIWGEQDAFHFVWKRLYGNFIVTMRAEFAGAGVNPHRKMGWMARTSLAPDSPHASTAIHGDGLVSLQFRRTPGGTTDEVKAALTGADVVQLERKGNTYLMSAARYGEPFSTVQVIDLDLGDEIYVGLFVCSHEQDVIERAVMQNVRIVMPVAEDFHRDKDPFGSHLEILDVDSGNRKIIFSSDGIFEAPNWSRDGKSLIYNSYGRLYRFDLATGSSTMIDTGDIIRNNNDHVLSFDGKMLAISSHHPGGNHSLIYTVPLEGGQPKLVTPTGPSYLHGWSPDGKYLVYCAQRHGDYDVYRIGVEGGEEERLTTTPGLDDGPEYTPDGHYIYFNSVRSGSMQIWRMKPDGSDQEQITDDDCNNWFAHIAPDGKSFVCISYLPNEAAAWDHPAAKRVYLRLLPLDGGTPKVLAYLYGGQGTINVPSWSPDGRQLAFVSNTVPQKAAQSDA